MGNFNLYKYSKAYKEGKEAEEIFESFYKNRGMDVLKTGLEDEYKDIDYWVNGHSFSVKCQKATEKTGNVAFETKLNHRPSWYEEGKAEFYAIFWGSHFRVYRATDLKNRTKFLEKTKAVRRKTVFRRKSNLTFSQHIELLLVPHGLIEDLVIEKIRC